MANGDVSGWDTSQVTNFNSVFQGARSFFEGGGLSGWNTSNATNMLPMLSSASGFNGGVSGWNTSQVISMEKMFQGAGASTTTTSLLGHLASHRHNIHVSQCRGIQQFHLKLGHLAGYNHGLNVQKCRRWRSPATSPVPGWNASQPDTGIKRSHATATRCWCSSIRIRVRNIDPNMTED
jgi:hypothetical protein